MHICECVSRASESAAPQHYYTTLLGSSARVQMKNERTQVSRDVRLHSSASVCDSQIVAMPFRGTRVHCLCCAPNRTHQQPGWLSRAGGKVLARFAHAPPRRMQRYCAACWRVDSLTFAPCVRLSRNARSMRAHDRHTQKRRNI